jgi:Ca2+-binding RTX toxin-like protein
MAVTLAACGGSSDTATVAPTTPVTPPAPTAIAFTVAGNEQPATTSGNDTFTALISTDADETTFDASDLLADASTTDADVLTLTTEAELTAANTATARNIETININIDMFAGAVPGTFNAALTNFSGVETINFDVVAANSVIDTLVVTAVNDEAAVVASTDFDTITVTAATAGSDITVRALSTAATAVTISAGEDDPDPANAVITAAGNLTLTAAGVTGVVDVTGAGDVTVATAAAAQLISIDAVGDATLTNGTAAVDLDIVSGGDVSVTATGAGDMNIMAAGTITTAGAILSTTATLSAVGQSSIVGDDLTTITVSGNGGDATFTMGAEAHEDLARINVTGSDGVTVVVDANEIEGALAINDSGTGTFTLDVGANAGIVTLSGSVVDQLNINVDLTNHDLSVVSGQTVTYTANQGTASNLVVGTAANAATNTVILNLNDENAASGAVDLAALTITQAQTVTVNAGLDVNADAAATNLTSLAATANNAALTINTGANNLTITTGITAGAEGNLGTVVVTGSGNVNHAAIAIAADSFNASAVTGNVVGTGAITGAVRSVSTGSGNDAVILGTNTLTSVSTGAGNDNITLFGGDYGTRLVTIDGGAGNDTLTFVDDALLTDLASGSSLSGIETIVFNAASVTQAIDASLLNDQTFAVRASATGATGTVNVDINATDTDIDLSGLVESTATATSMAGMRFVADASANANAITYTGATDALNTITGSASAGDVLTGGNLADIFVVTDDGLLFNASNVMLDTFVGGTSATGTRDSFRIGTADVAFTVVAADNWAGSTGVEEINAAGASDAAISLTLGATAETAGISRISLAADTEGDGANVVNVAAYTATGVTIVGSAGVDTITGGAGNDTITGGAGADVLSGGAGNDTFVFAGVTDLFTDTALTDTSIAGGDGVDVISLTQTTAITIADTAVWTGVTSVETISVAAANANAISIDLDASASTAGITTVDLSADTNAANGDGNVIDANEATISMTLTGGAGVETITGGAAADVIRGGGGNDVLSGGAGVDTYVFESTAALNGVDTITFVSADDRLDFTNFLGAGYSVLDGNGAVEGIGSYTVDANDDVDLTGKVAIFERSADKDGVALADLTAAEIFAEINGAGNAFALTAGKAVIISVDEDTDGGEDPSHAMSVWFIDTTLDGAAGLSVNDIVQVGDMVDVNALFGTLSADNFVV